MTRLLARVAGVVLRLSPKDFHARFSREFVNDLEHLLRDAAHSGGSMAMLSLWGRGLGDAMRTALQERRLAALQRASRWSDLGGDVKYALRGWRRSPGFTLTVITTLALGLGLASAIFAFADGYLFRPLPFPASERAYMVRDPNGQIAGALKASDVVALRQSAVADLGFVEWNAGNLFGDLLLGDRRTPISSCEVTKGFRRTLELPLFAGRDFSEDDHRAGAPLVAWLSHPFWVSTFGRDASVVGRHLRIEGPVRTVEVHIVGILGPEVASFDLNNPPPDLVIPQQGPPSVGRMTLAFPLVVLPEGTSSQQGAARIAAALQAVAPSTDGKPREVRLRSLLELQVDGGKPTAKVFLAGALLILLLASMNLIHLLLSRSMARAQEVSTRTALGASRWRVARVFLAESLMFGVCGIAAGLLIGRGLSGWIASRLPEYPTQGRNLSMVPMLFDERTVAVAVVLGLIVAIVGGLWPARMALGTFARAPRAISGRMARTVLASELTVATVVIVGAVFIGLGIYRYLNQPLGFEYTDRVRVSVRGADGRSAKGDSAVAAVSAVRSVAGVAHAAFESPANTTRDIEVHGRSVDTKAMPARAVTPGYFEAWGMRLRQGRWFEAAEFHDAAGVVVVDERFARLAWPDASAIGSTLKAAGAVRRVVGVVEPKREVLGTELPPMVYVPAPEAAGQWSIVAWVPGADVKDIGARLTDAVMTASPGSKVTVSEITFDNLFMRGIGEAKFQAPVVAAFGILAVTLAGIGVFGLVSYLVERRTREFGIRMALGARLNDIWRTVMRESIQPTLIGLVLGSAGALALESVVQSSVFGWKSSGPTAITIVVIGLLAVAVVAALVPAGRAARVDPARTLRAE